MWEDRRVHMVDVWQQENRKTFVSDLRHGPKHIFNSSTTRLPSPASPTQNIIWKINLKLSCPCVPSWCLRWYSSKRRKTEMYCGRLKMATSDSKPCCFTFLNEALLSNYNGHIQTWSVTDQMIRSIDPSQ